MPIPKPTGNETQNEYISRCVSEIITDYDQQQALGICYSTWDRENMNKTTSMERVMSKVSYLNEIKKLKL